MVADPPEVLVDGGTKEVARSGEEVARAEVLLVELPELVAVEGVPQALEGERVVEDVDVRGDSGVVCALAIPGTAIGAPPASAAAEPVKKRRLEVSERIPDPSGFRASVMYPLFFFRAGQ